MSNPWTLLNSHGLVLFYIAAHPESTMREMSAALDLTERRILELVVDLAEGDMIRINRVGRRNSYSVNHQAAFRHPTLQHLTLGEVESLISSCNPAQAPAVPGV